MAKIIETLLLLALPASGKSEVRKYLDNLPPESCMKDFNMGSTVQLDDFPYVHIMRRIDDELASIGEKRIYFHSADKSFIDPADWGTLIKLVSEDYDDLISKNYSKPQSAGFHLFDRLEKASGEVGIKPRISALQGPLLKKIGDKLEKEALDMLDKKHANYPESMKGKTMVIEFARGGPDKSSMPLPSPLGYQYSVAQLSPVILEKASILYIWVTPEESRRKNDARTDPNDPGSILHHGVPLEVMMNDYGCDDIDWLLKNSEKPGAVTIRAHGKAFNLPLGRFDNRVDKTSFLRDDAKTWKPEQVKELHAAVTEAFKTLKK
ncbi:hypothetical protein ACFL6Y_06715 [Elusimicrobiota bacterium]